MSSRSHHVRFVLITTNRLLSSSVVKICTKRLHLFKYQNLGTKISLLSPNCILQFINSIHSGGDVLIEIIAIDRIIAVLLQIYTTHVLVSLMVIFSLPRLSYVQYLIKNDFRTHRPTGSLYLEDCTRNSNLDD